VTPRRWWRRRVLRILPFAAIAAGGVGGFMRAGSAAHGATVATPRGETAPAAAIADAKVAYLRDCATCHGADARGTAVGSSLQGVGSAALDYWVSTGRMPLVANARPAKSPQGEAPPGQYLADPNAQIQRRTPVYSPAGVAALV
jgi:ubiquinol-cytochrome c reductase cytochrome c subunit